MGRMIFGTPTGCTFPRYMYKYDFQKERVRAERNLYEVTTGKNVRQNFRLKQEKIVINNIKKNKKYSSFFDNINNDVKQMTNTQLKSFINI